MLIFMAGPQWKLLNFSVIVLSNKVSQSVSQSVSHLSKCLLNTVVMSVNLDRLSVSNVFVNRSCVIQFCITFQV